MVKYFLQEVMISVHPGKMKNANNAVRSLGAESFCEGLFCFPELSNKFFFILRDLQSSDWVTSKR